MYIKFYKNNFMFEKVIKKVILNPIYGTFNNTDILLTRGIKSWNTLPCG